MHVRDAIQYFSFSVWLTSLSMMTKPIQVTQDIIGEENRDYSTGIHPENGNWLKSIPFWPGLFAMIRSSGLQWKDAMKKQAKNKERLLKSIKTIEYQEIESIIKKHPLNKSLGSDGLLGNSTKCLK